MNSDYNGFLPDHPQFADDIPPVIKFPDRPGFNSSLADVRRIVNQLPESPIQELTHEILEKQFQAKVYILEHLVKNPGFLATLEDFEVVFDDIQLETDFDSRRELNEYRIIVTQTARIRRKETDGTSLGRDPGGEAQEG